MMVERADAFVILPGGFGTLDEAFEILTWKKLKLHNKPVVIFNAYGYWDHFVGAGRLMPSRRVLKSRARSRSSKSSRM